MEVIRNSKHNNRNYIIVDTVLKIEKTEGLISAPIHIRVDVTDLTERDRAVVFGKINSTFNHLLVMKAKPQPPAKQPWWKTIFSK